MSQEQLPLLMPEPKLFSITLSLIIIKNHKSNRKSQIYIDMNPILSNSVSKKNDTVIQLRFPKGQPLHIPKCSRGGILCTRSIDY